MDPTLIDSQFLKQTRLTPRSEEAFRRSGILPSDIIYPTLHDFKDSLTTELAQIRLNATQVVRDNFMKVLARDYELIKTLESEGKWMP